MVVVMMIDLFAAFNMVDHQLLLEKFVLFGLDSGALRLMEAIWATDFSQFVLMGVCLPLCQ